MKKISLLGFAILAACSSNRDSDSMDHLDLVALGAPQRVILQNADLGEVASEVAKSGGAVVRHMDFTDAVVANVPPQALNGLKKKFAGLSITPDIEMSVVLPVEADSKPGTNTQPTPPPPPPGEVIPWGVAKIRATAAQAVARGQGVTVCIIDTGVDSTHPDLAANIMGGRNFVWNRGRVDSTAWRDDNGHGSHVAGTIAAVDNDIGVIGVAPAAKIYAVKALDSRGSGYLSDIADGVMECVSKGAQVINMSLGATSDPTAGSPFHTAVDYAASHGVTVVVAAGNEGQDINKTIPAGYSSVLAVSALDSNDAFPSWSNFGLGTKDFAAPGVSILSTWKSGGYNTISGTSMASPHVAGVVALKISAASLGLLGIDIGATLSRQGSGRIDALSTVNNH